MKEIDLKKNEISNKKNNDKKENENFEIDFMKYIFDYSSKLSNFSLEANPKQTFLLNLLLMSSKINIFNKLICLQKLNDIYKKEKNIDMMYNITYKIMKYLKEQRIPPLYININLLFASEFLNEQKNYFYTFKFIKEIKRSNINMNINLEKEIIEYIISRINIYKTIFINNIKYEKIKKLLEIINNILDESKNTNSYQKQINKNQNEDEIKNESNDNINNVDKINDKKINYCIKDKEERTKVCNEYLYIINRNWLENAKLFLENYEFAKETNMLNDFFNDSFNSNYALKTYLSEEKIREIPEGHIYYPFPGPINNFPLVVYKDKWIDPNNKEEDAILNNSILFGKDYCIITSNDWAILKNSFSYTNEIKRRKNNINMTQISAFIFDQRFKLDKNKNINLFKKKVIQIGINESVSEFYEKILRCTDYALNNEKIQNKINVNEINDDKEFNENKQLLFYKLSKKNKDIIIEMYISFINNIQSYESIFIKEIKFAKNERIQNIFEKYNSKKELLIIEIIEKNSNIQFLSQINPTSNSESNKIYNCSICSKEITDLNNTKYNCELCSMYLFCSKECAKNKSSKNGMNHHELHKYLSELILKKFNLSEFLSRKFYPYIYTNENGNKNKGITSLFNLGNTCYINCSIQCLSHTKDLTKYILNNYYQNEINLANSLGSNGALLKAYSDLINSMWMSNLNKINPYIFRIAFCESTQQFMNNHQQDAMEFISILLNYLHEDLNRVTNKQYIKIREQKATENDDQASQRSLDCNLQRDDSIIFDLFNGQFKNMIKCLNCQNIKKTYEPFINISLPIPVQHNFYIIKFFTHLKCKYITMNVNSETTLFDLINTAINYLDKEIIDSLKNIKANNSYKNLLLFNSMELVKLNKNKIINEIYSKIENNVQISENYGKKLASIMENDEEIVLFQKNIIQDNCIKNIYVYPIMTDENNIDKINFLSYPVVLSINENMTLDNLEKLIFESFKHIIDTKKLKNGNYIIDLNILHSSKNLNKGFLGIIKEYQPCSFCNESYDSKKYCPLYLSLNKSDTILKLFQYSNNSEPLVLLARSYFYDKTKKVYPNDNFEEINIINKYKNIYDSFNSFDSFEDLGGDSLWLCSNCHQRTTISKAIKIFKPPNYLIIQLKRFKKKSDSFFSLLEGDKNTTFVSFPTKNLSLSNYIDGPDKISAIYNLYAVINHKSLIGFNHFTAFCRNNNRWLEFNDSKISEISKIITEDAYILFYVKKEIDE